MNDPRIDPNTYGPDRPTLDDIKTMSPKMTWLAERTATTQGLRLSSDRVMGSAVQGQDPFVAALQNTLWETAQEMAESGVAPEQVDEIGKEMLPSIMNWGSNQGAVMPEGKKMWDTLGYQAPQGDQQGEPLPDPAEFDGESDDEFIRRIDEIRKHRANPPQAPEYKRPNAPSLEQFLLMGAFMFLDKDNAAQYLGMPFAEQSRRAEENYAIAKDKYADELKKYGMKGDSLEWELKVLDANIQRNLDRKLKEELAKDKDRAGQEKRLSNQFYNPPIKGARAPGAKAALAEWLERFPDSAPSGEQARAHIAQLEAIDAQDQEEVKLKNEGERLDQMIKKTLLPHQVEKYKKDAAYQGLVNQIKQVELNYLPEEKALAIAAKRADMEDAKERLRIDREQLALSQTRENRMLAQSSQAMYEKAVDDTLAALRIEIQDVDSQIKIAESRRKEIVDANKKEIEGGAESGMSPSGPSLELAGLHEKKAGLIRTAARIRSEREQATRTVPAAPAQSSSGGWEKGADGVVRKKT